MQQLMPVTRVCTVMALSVVAFFCASSARGQARTIRWKVRRLLHAGGESPKLICGQDHHTLLCVARHGRRADVDMIPNRITVMCVGDHPLMRASCVCPCQRHGMAKLRGDGNAGRSKYGRPRRENEARYGGRADRSAITSRLTPKEKYPLWTPLKRKKGSVASFKCRQVCRRASVVGS
jgi:hypothetical protein